MDKVWKRVLQFAVCCVGALTVPAVSAQLLTAITVIGGSAAVDRAGKELRDSIDHARAAAESLLGRADDIAKRRLEQVDGILRDTVGGLIDKSEQAVLNVLTEAKRQIDTLEQQILTDVKKVIWEAECAGRRLVISDLGTALGRLGDVVGTSRVEMWRGGSRSLHRCCRPFRLAVPQ